MADKMVGGATVNLTSLRVVRDLVCRYGIRPSRTQGQNFLVDRNVLERILEAAELTGQEVVLEIGCGLGTLTAALAERARWVVGVEKDPRCVAALRETLVACPNVEVYEADALAAPLEEWLSCRTGTGRGVVVANLPYHISKPLLQRLLALRKRLDRLVLMLQREVAERLIAVPGSKTYGVLSIATQLYCETELLRRVSPTCFWPPPEVESALVRLRVREEPQVPLEDEEWFFTVVSAAFTQRRKTLRNALRGLADHHTLQEACRQVGLDPARRGETLTLAEFAALSAALRLPI